MAASPRGRVVLSGPLAWRSMRRRSENEGRPRAATQEALSAGGIGAVDANGGVEAEAVSGLAGVSEPRAGSPGAAPALHGPGRVGHRPDRRKVLNSLFLVTTIRGPA
jgi:hypothetical protein